MRSAQYSLIQYFHDRKRCEGVNVGVVLIADGRAHVRFATLRGLFARVAVARTRKTEILRAMEGLRERLSSVTTGEALEAFAGAEVGQLGLPKVRRAVVDDAEQMLARLFDDLVGEPPKRERHVAKDPDVQQELIGLFASEAAKMATNVELEVPGVAEALSVPVAYRNGAMNYVLGKGFVGDEERALELAKALAATGHLIASERAKDGAEQKLLVRAELENDALGPAIHDVFRRFKVDVFTDPESLRARVLQDLRHAD